MFRKIKEVAKEIFQTVNPINSSMGVQCVAPDRCRFRHTASCDNCKNNIGCYEEQCFYEPR